MKKLLIQIITFFKKDHMIKYVVITLGFVLMFSLLLHMAAADVVDNVFGTIVGFTISSILLYVCKIVVGRLEDMLKINYDTDSLMEIYHGRPDYKKCVDNLRNWFNSHLKWLDEQMATQESLRNSLGYSASSRLALSLADADGKALDADAAEVAPADGVAAKGQALRLTITGGSNTDGNAVLYVNGRRTSVTAINANSTIVVDVPADALTAKYGEKNVLEVQIEKADGTINASRYVTVRTKGIPSPAVIQQMMEESIRKLISSNALKLDVLFR
jgi:hypothetical protein